MPSTVFKAYDIRGLAPEEIDAPFAKRLGRAIAAQFAPKTVLVGRDMRLTSFTLETALIEGLVASGVDVVRIGLCSTPMFNVLIHLAKGKYDLGVMVTASHNPGKYNGFKITLGDGAPVGQGSGMEELERTFRGTEEPRAENVGRVTDDLQALDRYVNHVIALADLPDGMPKMKVAIDAGNGMAGAVLPRLLSKLPWIDVVSLYFDPDGTFPNHEANPLKEETLAHLQETVRKEKCALGVAFDGDADRIGFVDEKGDILSGDLLTAFLGEEVLRDEPGGHVHYDVRSSWAVPDAIQAAGGHASMSRVGHAFIKKLMRSSKAIFAGELSMHFYFRELGNFESGDYAMLLMLRRLAREGKPFSELAAPLRRFSKSPEINFTVKDTAAALVAIKAAYESKSETVTEIDGLRLEFQDYANPSEDWWFSVRASNTEPLLRLNVEAKTSDGLKRHVEELSAFIKKLQS